MKHVNQLSRRRHPRRGVALVLVLAFVVLVTGLVLAFFSRAQVSRQVSNSSATQMKADVLARGALDTIVGDLKQEIDTGSNPTTVGNTTIFTPKVPANMVAVRSGNPGTPPFTAVNPDPIPNLVRRSVRSDAIVSPGVSSRASAVSSLDPSRNDRSVSAARWNAHYLIPKLVTTNDDTDPIATFIPPDWVIVTRGGPVAFTAWDDSLSNASPANQNYAIGRYAFAIYDESGLLDMNVAGYPSGLTTAQIGRKGALALADLTQLGLPQAQVDNIVGWRNFATAQPTGFFDNKTSPSQFVFTATSAKNWLDNFVLNNPSGFLKVSTTTAATGQTDQAFLSRQQLIDLRRSLGFSVNALQYLGTFSRAVNAPSWKPTTLTGSTIDYAGQAENPSSANRNIPNVRFPNATNIVHYRDDGSIEPYSATETSFSYKVQAGEPLVQRRFSLAKLAWLAPDGPKSGISDTAIRACFGLQWDSSKWRWEYVAAKVPPGVRIKTLEEVAAENREPNFFELLNAGILKGSLGRDPGLGMDQSVAPGVGVYSSQFNLYKSEPNLHILQIGANIIDQYDTDSYPTAIHFDAWGLTGADDLSLQTVYGIENLPALTGLFCIAIADPVPPGGGANGVLKSWIQPQLWNPHQVPSATLSDYPSGFRAYAYGKIYILWSTAASWSPHTPFAPWTNYDDGFGNQGTPGQPGEVYFNNPPNATSPFYNNPVALTLDLKTTGSSPTAIVDPTQTPSANYYDASKWASLGGDVFGSDGLPSNKFVGFSLSVDPNYNPDPNTGNVGRKMLLPDLASRAYFSLQYKGTDGNYHPYNFMARLTQDTRQDFKHMKPSRETNATSGSPPITITPTTTVVGETASRGNGAIRLDPRTDRFSESTQQWLTAGTTVTMNSTPNVYNPPYGGGGTGSKAYCIPYMPGYFNYVPVYDTIGTNNGHIELWLRNDISYSVTISGTPTNAYYADPDGVVRLADGYRGNIATGDGCGLYIGNAGVVPASTLTTPGTGSVQSRRPVILNRPFRSVGELGFAYRDLPFKSLDFWSPTSADGGLLDLFSISDEPAISAGMINPSKASAPVLQAILAGTFKSDALGVQISGTEAQSLSGVIATDVSANGPYQSRADLATRLGPLVSGTGSQVAFNTTTSGSYNWANKAYAEAPVRVLADVSSTRTWNLMIDVIAQTGIFPPGAASLTGFTVQAERRYWLHIAIDRLTGAVVGQQLEPVYE
ncbi:MAG: hypothetical protein WCQ57_04615 [Verrucomicrobiota bacterium]